MIQPMMFKRRRTLPAHRLPYVGNTVYTDPMGRIGYWDVPLIGGYSGGWTTGGALALIALKHMSNYAQRVDGDHLKYIAASWIDRASQASPEELETLKAQVMGFMAEIGKFTEASAVGSRLRLSQIDDKTVLKKANEGLGFMAPERARRTQTNDEHSARNADSIKG